MGKSDGQDSNVSNFEPKPYPYVPWSKYVKIHICGLWPFIQEWDPHHRYISPHENGLMTAITIPQYGYNPTCDYGRVHTSHYISHDIPIHSYKFHVQPLLCNGRTLINLPSNSHYIPLKIPLYSIMFH